MRRYGNQHGSQILVIQTKFLSSSPDSWEASTQELQDIIVWLTGRRVNGNTSNSNSTTSRNINSAHSSKKKGERVVEMIAIIIARIGL